MPIYEFVCSQCGHEFEKILSFSATSMPACANCGSDNVERQMGRPAIHFKGSGWYINDSKKGNSKKGNNNPASAANGESSDSGGSVSDGTKAESGGTEGASSETKSTDSGSKGESTSSETGSSSVKTETA